MDVLSRSLAVLALVCALAAGTVGSTASTAHATTAAGDCSPGSDWGTLRADFAAQTVDLVNAHRASLGLSQLAVGSALQASAVWKARHMAKYGYMAHDDPAPPVSRSTGERMAACGVTGSWGENIAAGFPSPASVVSGWLNSPGHRANIENPNYVSMGSGAAASASGQLYWAHTFSSSGRGRAASTASATAAPAASADDTVATPDNGAGPRTISAAARPESTGAARHSRYRSAGSEDGLRCEPAQFPPVDAHSEAAGRGACARKQGRRAEARSEAEDGPCLLQRTAQRPSAQGADAPPACRLGGVRLAAAAGRPRLDGQRDRRRAAGPPARADAVPRQDLLIARATAVAGAKG